MTSNRDAVTQCRSTFTRAGVELQDRAHTTREAGISRNPHVQARAICVHLARGRHKAWAQIKKRACIKPLFIKMSKTRCTEKAEAEVSFCLSQELERQKHSLGPHCMMNTFLGGWQERTMLIHKERRTAMISVRSQRLVTRLSIGSRVKIYRSSSWSIRGYGPRQDSFVTAIPLRSSLSTALCASSGGPVTGMRISPRASSTCSGEFSRLARHFAIALDSIVDCGAFTP